MLTPLLTEPKLLCVHNWYRQPGGEDAVFNAEAALLRSRGHGVLEYTEHNSEVERLTAPAAAARTFWSANSCRRVRRLLSDGRPDVAHIHNTFPLISPSVYHACRKAGVPVVQTLHNFRLICPAATLFRGGLPCEDCVGRTVPWPGVLHRCYHGSRTQTVALAGMLAFHRLIGTWAEQVDVHIALTDFARRKFIEGGLPAERIVVKPNFVHPDPGMKDGEGEYAVFVGRLSEEKGVRTLLRAWRSLGDVPLRIAGDGPLTGEARRFVNSERLRSVDVLGRVGRDEVISLMKGARLLVFPSGWYEGFPLVLAEAFACGLPAVVSRLGAMEEIVEDGRTGLHFNPGDPEDLAAMVEWAWAHPEEMAEMGREARLEYERKYTAERNYQMLMDIYDRAISRTRH